jgi:AraC family transcriptional regulator
MNKNQKIIDSVLLKIEKEIESIDIDQVIEYSGFSYFHFHRIFFAYVGESIKQYIKRLRLEKAAHDIKYKRATITAVALDSGYATASAFNKAFKEFFDCNPSEYKKIELRAEEYSMIEPIRVEEIEPIKVYSIRHVGDYNKIGVAFEKLMKWAYTNKIKNKKNLMGKDAYSYGIAYDDPNITDIDKLRSDACISNSDDSVELDEGIIKQDISGGKYAVFLHIGEYSKLKDTYNSIFSSYIKRDDLKLRDVPIFERYLNRDPRRTKPENLKTEIYIPLY